MKYVVRYGVLMITTGEHTESEEYMETLAYPVADLVPPGPDGTVNLQPLTNLLITTVATKSWVDNGGTGTMSAIVVGKRPLLVVAQTTEVQEEIEDMLEMLRKAGGLKTAARHVGRDDAAEAKIRAALEQPTQIEFVETPLKDVIEYLKDKHKIEIQLHSSALKEAGVDESEPVTKNLKGISLRSALRLLLDERQLKYVVHNGVLLITSPGKAESEEWMVTRAYAVDDLAAPQHGKPADLRPLKDLLTNTVASKTWEDNGGAGTLSEILVNRRPLLVVAQFSEVQEKIEDTLAMLRKAGGLKAPE